MTREDDRNETAFRAVTKMRSMTPMLTSFARAVTGRSDVTVQVGQTSRTNGKVIELRAPIDLGRTYRHDQLQCGRRDDKSQQVCPACRQLDDVYATVFHEIAHIAYDSFESLREKDQAEFTSRVIFEKPSMPGTRVAKLRERIEAMTRKERASYMTLAGAISPFLPVIINCLEDARVNRAMYQARPGTYHMFRADAIDTLEHGQEQADGSVLHWRDQPLDNQAIIGLFCKASEFDYADWFKPEVVTALDDPALSMELAQLATARSAASIYRLGFPVLEHLRRLGFCKRNDDLEDDPPTVAIAVLTDEEPEAGESDDDEGEDVEVVAVAPSAPEQDDKDDDNEKDDEDVAGGHDDGDTPESDDPTGDDSDETESEDDADGDDDGQESDDASDGPGEEGVESPEGADDSDGDDQGESGEEDEPDDADDPAESDDDSFAGDDGDEGDGDDAGDDRDGLGDEDADDDDADGGDAGEESGPEDAGAALAAFGGHAVEAPTREELEEQAAIDVAIRQAEHFDAPSHTVAGVKVVTFDEGRKHGQGPWAGLRQPYYVKEYHLDDVPFWMPPEKIVGESLLKLRTVFAENKKARRDPGMRSGRIVANRLASVPTGNDKVFARVTKPGKRDHFVLLSLDCSGSTSGRRIERVKLFGMALAEMLNRIGVKFAVYGHSGDQTRHLWNLEVYVVKEANELWSDATRRRLAGINAYACNLDGHMLEYCRKRCDEMATTDKHILYVTDGSMPAENASDELRILQREIVTCRKSGYHLIGVGVNTDSPTRHGLETVRLDRVDDIPKLIREMERRLAVSA